MSLGSVSFVMVCFGWVGSGSVWQSRWAMVRWGKIWFGIVWSGEIWQLWTGGVDWVMVC